MQGGDHVLVELVDLSAGAHRGLRGIRLRPEESGSSACLPIALGLDRSFPMRDYGPFFDGEYGVNVHVGPVDEYEATAGARPPRRPSGRRLRGAARYRRDHSHASSGEDPEATHASTGETRRNEPSRRGEHPAPAGHAVRVRLQAVATGSTFDPFDFDAVGAIICEKGLARQGERPSWRSSGSRTPRGTMADYWGYRLNRCRAGCPEASSLVGTGREASPPGVTGRSPATRVHLGSRDPGSLAGSGGRTSGRIPTDWSMPPTWTSRGSLAGGLTTDPRPDSHVDSHGCHIRSHGGGAGGRGPELGPTWGAPKCHDGRHLDGL